MTATLHRIHAASAAEAHEAEAMRVTGQTLPGHQARWSGNRKAQRDDKTGVYQPLAEPVPTPWRIRHVLGCLGLVTVFCVYQWSVM